MKLAGLQVSSKREKEAAETEAFQHLSWCALIYLHTQREREKRERHVAGLQLRSDIWLCTPFPKLPHVTCTAWVAVRRVAAGGCSWRLPQSHGTPCARPIPRNNAPLLMHSPRRVQARPPHGHRGAAAARAGHHELPLRLLARHRILRRAGGLRGRVRDAGPWAGIRPHGVDLPPGQGFSHVHQGGCQSQCTAAVCGCLITKSVQPTRMGPQPRHKPPTEQGCAPGHVSCSRTVVCLRMCLACSYT